MSRKLICALTFAITGLGLAGPAVSKPVELPVPTGPYKVGTTAWHVTDPARPETFAAAGVPRQVEVLAWYPAAPDGAGAPAPYLREGVAEMPPRLRDALASPLSSLRTHAILDAPPVVSPKKLPVLVFSHGIGGSPSSYTALLEDLASHGYAVLSVVHPYEATAATLADGQVIPMFDAAGKPRQTFTDILAEWEHEDEIMAAVTREPKEAEQLRLLRNYLSGLHATHAALNRWVKDTKLVLDRLSEVPKTSAAGRLVDRLDLGRIGVLGHSMGGVTAGEFCLEDRRCRAGLNLDGIPQYGTMIDRRMPRPFLMVYSGRPGRTGASDAIYRRAASRYIRCDVRDTKHVDFSDMVLWDGPLRQGEALGTLPPARAVEITRTIVRQYFDQELLGKRSPVLAGKVTLPEVTVKTFPKRAR
jgi:predicted dienelactone hydrolase